MEAQLQSHHHYEEDPHNAGLHSGIGGEAGVREEHTHHKKSVLKKVKDKANKIKDTMKKHGHGHEHEHEYHHDRTSEEEDDDEDEETMNDPEVHGAPIYESAVIRGTNLPMQTGVNLERPTNVREDRCSAHLEDIGVPRSFDPGKMETEWGRPPVEAREPELKNPMQYPNVEDIGVTRPVGPGKMETERGKPPVEASEPELKNSLQSPYAEDIGAAMSVGVEKMDPELGRPEKEAREPDIENPNWEDQNNVRNEVFPNVRDTELGRPLIGADEPSFKNPTWEGRDNARDEVSVEEIGVTRILGPGKMKFELGRPTMGAHGPDLKNPTWEEDRDNIRDEVFPNVKDIGVTRPSGIGEMETGLGGAPSEAREPEFKNPRSGIKDALGKDEANVGEPMARIGPMMGLEKDPHRPGETPFSNYETKVVDPTGHGTKEAEVDPLIRRLDNVRVSDEADRDPAPQQRSYTGSHDQFAPQLTPTKDEFIPKSDPVGLIDEPELPKHFDSAQPESMSRDTIAGKISSVTHVIADNAVSAKNVVALKLGYGGEHQESKDSFSKKPVSESATEYGHTVAEQLSPVYEKVAGAGEAILSKVQGGGGAVDPAGNTAVKGVVDEGGDTVAKGADKGISVKEYLAMKLRPGDEDRALSEVITEALQKKKEGMRRTGEEQPREQEVVAAHLGAGGENKREEDTVVAGSESATSGGGVVDRLKGAVHSWLGKSTGTQTAQESLGHSYAGGIVHDKEEVSSQQRRLQESGN